MRLYIYKYIQTCDVCVCAIIWYTVVDFVVRGGKTVFRALSPIIPYSPADRYIIIITMIITSLGIPHTCIWRSRTEWFIGPYISCVSTINYYVHFRFAIRAGKPIICCKYIYIYIYVYTIKGLLHFTRLVYTYI